MSYCGTGGAIATFDISSFLGQFPEFCTLSETALQGLFATAGLFVNNVGYSAISDPFVQSQVMNLVVAHLAAMRFGVNGQPPSPLVGRISSASEGSVSVSADMAGASASAAWWNQTTYGATVWQATNKYRRATYVSGPVSHGVGAQGPGAGIGWIG